jgi:hypothetical protein
MAALLRLLAALLLSVAACAKLVTFRNDIPRLDTAGNIIDCHSGMILAVNGTFYMYGEHCECMPSSSEGPSSVSHLCLSLCPPPTPPLRWQLLWHWPFPSPAVP